MYVQAIPTGAHAIPPVPTSNTAFVDVFEDGPVGEPTVVQNFGEFQRKFGGLWEPSRASYGIFQFFTGGGTTAIVVRVAGDGPPRAADLVGEEDDENPTGMYALAGLQPGVLNILCIPAMAHTADPAPVAAWQYVFEQAVRFCEEQHAFLIADAVDTWAKKPASEQVQAIKAFYDRFMSNKTDHAAVYFPRVTMPDPLAGYAPLDTENSGALAGIYARTDVEFGVWKPPAGINAVLMSATPTIEISDDDNAELNELGINCLRTFPVYGSVSWGSRTLRGADLLDSDWKYVNVRRLALYIEQAVQLGTQWAVFEPNDEPLWAALRSEVSSFLDNLYREGALAGTKPQNAYFVRCDASTTTSVDQANGILNLTVGFASQYPAEFAVITITHHMTTGV